MNALWASFSEAPLCGDHEILDIGEDGTGCKVASVGQLVNGKLGYIDRVRIYGTHFFPSEN